MVEILIRHSTSHGKKAANYCQPYNRLNPDPNPNPNYLSFKMSLRAKLFLGNEFDLREKKRVGGTHFHMNGFTRRLVLTQRQKTTIDVDSNSNR